MWTKPVDLLMPLRGLPEYRTSLESMVCVFALGSHLANIYTQVENDFAIYIIKYEHQKVLGTSFSLKNDTGKSHWTKHDPLHYRSFYYLSSWGLM